MFSTSMFLRNCHIQTLYAPFFRKKPLNKVNIETFELSDGDFVECHWYKNKPRNQEPIVILLHGLAGSVNSPYIQGIMRALEEKGLHSVLMHFRGCAGQENRLARSYHSGDTDDIKAWVSYLHEQYPHNPLYAIGYSIGGNVLLKLLGEEADKTPISMAVSVSAPMDLAVTAEVINQNFSRIYEKNLLKPLKKSLLNKFVKFNLQNILNSSKKDILNIRNIRELDERYTAPMHGFKSAAEYYEKSSSKQYLKSIKVPTLIIHALDDPFMDERVLPTKAELSPFVTLELSKNGGHVGFVAGTLFKPIYWLEVRILAYF